MSLLGTQVKFPGSFWEGRMTAEEKAADYLCTVLDFQIAHRMQPGAPPTQAFQLQEMGTDGTGSLERSDLESTKFWCGYPAPFLEHYYKTFPEEAADAPAPAPPGSGGSGEAQTAINPSDSSSAFPKLRNGTAEVFQYWTINSDKLIEMGKHAGQYSAEFECTIELEGGGLCGCKRTLPHQPGKGVANSNLIAHLRTMAPKCANHKAALQKVEAESKNCIEVDGDMVQIHNFSEAFAHHVDLVWLRCIGLSHTMTKKPEFRAYVRGYEPRASFPHIYTIDWIAEAIDALQAEARRNRIARLNKEYKGGMCVGVQLDMWTDTTTHTAFACATMTYVDEPRKDEGQQLWLRSEIIDFGIFPSNSKTGEAIKNWFVNVLLANKLPHNMIAGITPDGAADGQCGLAMIADLGEKVDTCLLHVLQRAVLNAIGLASATSKNPEMKDLLRKHNRAVTLTRQSLATGKMIADAQRAASVPEHKLLTLVRTAQTRWGNQYSQVSTDNMLRLAIDPAVHKFKQDNRGNKEAIVEADETEQGGRAGRAVPAAELGLDDEDWDASQETEAVLSYPFDIKETIEHVPFCTGAQSMALLYDLKQNFCDPAADLAVKPFPVTLSVADRDYRNSKTNLITRESADLSEGVLKAREVMQDELNSRLFHGQDHLRPSNARLIQAYMSKQMPVADYLPDSWVRHGKTLYLQGLRAAVAIANVATRVSPPRLAKKPKTSLGLFRGAALAKNVDSEAPPPSANGGTPDDFDPLTDEVARWAGMGVEEYEKFTTEDGLLNEFAMMWALRNKFPLHYVLFKQTACHLPHEANVEQIFSRAGLLADPNLNPAHLAVLVRIGFNKKAFEPAVAAIKEKYYELFRGKGGEHKEGSSGAAGAASSSAAGAAGAASSSDAADVAS